MWWGGVMWWVGGDVVGWWGGVGWGGVMWWGWGVAWYICVPSELLYVALMMCCRSRPSGRKEGRVSTCVSSWLRHPNWSRATITTS